MSCKGKKKKEEEEEESAMDKNNNKEEEGSDEDDDNDDIDRKDIHLKALEDLVSVNSLFTIAVFIGISFATAPNEHSSLEIRPECMADTRMRKRVIQFEIISFGCFLFSSLVAKSLKIYLNMFHTTMNGPILKPIRGIGFLLSVLASIAGVILLSFSVAYVVQIKVGKISCGNHEALNAIWSLGALVGSGLLIYLFSMVLAILYCFVF